MPQYAYTINGQRHVFEGPDPQTTARFAQRWAATQASARTPLAANDNRPQVGPRQSQFAMDVGARAKKDVADLTGAIGQVKAHPASLMNGPNILTAVSRYIPNAFGLVPAAAVDQVTGPVVRGINSTFHTHFDPRYATDQLLNAAGLLSGAPEAWWPETSSLARAAKAADETPLVAAEASAPPQPIPPRPAPHLTVAYTAPKVLKNVLGQNSAKEPVVPLSDGFVYNHQQRMEALQDLPEDIQDKYHSAIADHIIDPILDDPDYHGHNAGAVQNILRELTTMAGEQRGSGGSPRLADALDAANEDFRVMVNQQQPEMARELGLTLPGGNISGDPSTPEPGVDPTGPGGILLSFEQHVAPPKGPYDDLDLDEFGEDIGDYLEELQKKVGPEPVVNLMNLWRDINAPANDNFPQLNWAGRVKPQKPLEFPFMDLDRMKSINELLPESELQEWMRSAANDNPQSSGQDFQQYLNELKSAAQVQVPPSGNAPGAPLRLVWSAPPPSPPNAFSGAHAGPQTPGSTTAPSAPRQVNAFDFNALRPPQWGPLGMVAAVNQPRYPQQPQN